LAIARVGQVPRTARRIIAQHAKAAPASARRCGRKIKSIPQKPTAMAANRRGRALFA